MSQFDWNWQGSWKESICTNFQFSSKWSWKKSTVAICEGSWNESMCTNFLNPSELSAAAVYEGSWKESICTISLISPKWSWKESVCVATLLVALIPAVLSILYGDVLLYLWLLCLCLGCTGDILLGSMANSLLLCSMGISPLSMGSTWAAGGHWGCLSTSCLALYCWGWISLAVQVLLIMSPSPSLWLISFLKWNLKHLLVPCHNFLF